MVLLTLIVILSLCIISVSAEEVEITYYTDASCSYEGRPVTKSNPFVCRVGSCCQYQGDTSIHVNSCGGGKFHYTFYPAPGGCRGNGQGGSLPLNKCINLGGGAEIVKCID